MTDRQPNRREEADMEAFLASPAGAALTSDLENPSVWSEPSAGLADRVVGAIEQLAAQQTSGNVVDLQTARSRRLSRAMKVAPWAVAAAAVVVAATITLRPSPAPPRDFAVALAGTNLASGASGHADVRNTPSGVEIRLIVRGLPRAPAGSYYQAWLKGERGRVAVGTFHTGGEVVLWSGVDVRDYPDMTVTLEAEGQPAGAGQRLMAGHAVEE